MCSNEGDEVVLSLVRVVCLMLGHVLSFGYTVVANDACLIIHEVFGHKM